MIGKWQNKIYYHLKVLSVKPLITHCTFDFFKNLIYLALLVVIPNKS